jgi:hypothetical protein
MSRREDKQIDQRVRLAKDYADKLMRNHYLDYSTAIDLGAQIAMKKITYGDALRNLGLLD